MTHRALDFGVAVPPGRGDMLGQLAAGVALCFKGVLDIVHNGSAFRILPDFPTIAQFFMMSRYQPVSEKYVIETAGHYHV